MLILIGLIWAQTLLSDFTRVVIMKIEKNTLSTDSGSSSSKINSELNSEISACHSYDEIIRLICEIRLELTGREIDCYLLLAEGYRSKEVAKELSISYRTVEKHVENIKDKLACQTLAGVISKISRCLYTELNSE